MKKVVLLSVLGSPLGSALPAAETNRVEIDAKQIGAVTRGVVVPSRAGMNVSLGFLQGEIAPALVRYQG